MQTQCVTATCPGKVLPRLLLLLTGRVSAPKAQYSYCHPVCTGRILFDSLKASSHQYGFLHVKPACNDLLTFALLT